MMLNPFYIAIIIALIAMLVIASLRPKWVVYFYVGILLFSSGSTWGLEEGEKVFNIYSKGTGVLPVSLLNVFLLGLVPFAFLLWRRNGAEAAFNLRKYFIAFSLLFFGYFLAGLFSDVPLKEILGAKGVINVVNMAVMAVVLRRVFSTEGDARQLGRFVVVCALARDLWGIVRFLFLGGDPANYYENYQHIGVRITFFDIDDSLVAGVAAFIAAWELQWNRRQLPRLWKQLYLATIAAALFVIVFSFRRTAWIGLVLAALPLLWMLPRHRRAAAIAIFGSVSVFIFGFVAFWRFKSAAAHQGFVGTLFSDVYGTGRHADIEHGRFAELIAGFNTIWQHPIFGIGPWGEFNFGFQEFVHSGFVHVWIKTGFVGFAIFTLIFLAFFRFVSRRRGAIAPERRGLYEAGVAGLLFMVPTLLFGTPVIEYRTMQLLGLVLALPYIAYAAELRRRRQNQKGVLGNAKPPLIPVAAVTSPPARRQPSAR